MLGAGDGSGSAPALREQDIRPDDGCIKSNTVVHRRRCLTRTGRLKSPVEGARPGLAWEVSHGERWAGKEKESGSLAVVLASSKV